MARQSCTGSWAVWLYSIALVQQSFIIKLLKEPPKRLYIFVVISDIRIVQIDKISHFFRKLAPLLSIHHHVLTALTVIIFHRYIFITGMIVDVSLCYAQFLFYTKFNRKSVSIPSCLAADHISLHRLITVERVFYRTCQNVMYTGMTVR